MSEQNIKEIAGTLAGRIGASLDSESYFEVNPDSVEVSLSYNSGRGTLEAVVSASGSMTDETKDVDAYIESFGDDLREEFELKCEESDDYDNSDAAFYRWAETYYDSWSDEEFAKAKVDFERVAQNVITTAVAEDADVDVETSLTRA